MRKPKKILPLFGDSKIENPKIFVVLLWFCTVFVQASVASQGLY
jgi:hypothetical protein